jgi:hypothetical protein
MKAAKLTAWVKEWSPVRSEMLALLDERAKREPNFYRRYAEKEIEAVDPCWHAWKRWRDE